MIQIDGIHAYLNDATHHICLGVFDGFHVGHQMLVQKSKYMVSFYPHPKEVLHGTSMQWLTTRTEQTLYHPHRLYIPFNSTIAELLAPDFLDKIIGPLLSPSRITVGYDFKFGKNKQGNIRLLREWCTRNHCACIEVPKQTLPNGTPYKSSIIRDALGNDFKHAVALLGHPYLIYGTVISGDKRGRQLGFPTANLQPESNKLIPKMGVYKATATLNNVTHQAIVYIGNKPTFSSSKTSIEVHILNGFNADIYGQSLYIELSHFIRTHQAFDTTEALIRQINRDICTVVADRF